MRHAAPSDPDRKTAGAHQVFFSFVFVSTVSALLRGDTKRFEGHAKSLH